MNLTWNDFELNPASAVWGQQLAACEIALYFWAMSTAYDIFISTFWPFGKESVVKYKLSACCVSKLFFVLLWYADGLRCASSKQD
jgi:hypothetical protein